MAEQRPEQEPWRDPIVAEVRRAREELYAEAGYDIREFCRRIRERQDTAGHRMVKWTPEPSTALR